ncbi:hypothetical protein NB689_001432 [Xanthomonas sacchari]|nr:hypothetical protein [Xanthomonas sacchari]MCW0449080.1 hypothetical protein [Xanthomonas sacchari]
MAEKPLASLTLMLKAKLPAALGVPDSTPAGVRLSPVGSAPLTTL